MKPGSQLLVHSGDLTFEFDKKTGVILSAFSDGKEIALYNGPRFMTKQEFELSGLKHYKDDNGQYVVDFSFQGSIDKFRNIQYGIKWTARPNGLA